MTSNFKKVHFIAIGGSAMHQLAIEMHLNGYEVSGSDDEIYEPAKSALMACGIYPNSIGWDERRVHQNLDLVILGMHAKKDNPELKKAHALGLRVMSYPEFIYQHAVNKKRIVVAGSHGKTTTTSILMHVFKSLNIDFDYLVGAQVDGFDRNVRLSNSGIVLIEGDEYLSSPEDSRSKFLHYRPHLSVITGIAWDHINVFTTFEQYLDTFKNFLETHDPNGVCYYFKGDDNLQRLACENFRVRMLPYGSLTGFKDGFIYFEGNAYPFPLIGQHNLQNAGGAWCICQGLGLSFSDFLTALSAFRGAKKRLQLLAEVGNAKIFLDFAHAPSKVKATIGAVKEWYPSTQLIAILELHTFSSLNRNFIPLYKDTLKDADKAIVFVNEHTLRMKGMPDLTVRFIKESFNFPELKVLFNVRELKESLMEITGGTQNFLFMSSGNFGGLDILECFK